jgi:S1-C subfamily serine protease
LCLNHKLIESSHESKIYAMKPTCAFIVALASCLSAAAAQQAPGDSEVVARISAATVLILSGEGAGRLSSISTGVIVRPNGVILTAYHAIKNAKEVQVRLRSGDVYDQVVLLGADERRDVAALRISAASLPTLPLGMGTEAKPGDSAYVVSSSSGLGWSASKGIIAALRLADEIPGAGQGFRLLQFTAPVSSGASGGPLVDSQGALLGIITKGIAGGSGGAPAEAGFAVPIETVIGLADGSRSQALGSGVALQMPASRPSPSTAAVVTSSAQGILRAARTIHIASRSMYFTPDSLEKALAGQKGFESLGLVIVKDMRVADLLITVDRPLFTYTFTYSVTDPRTSRVLDSGKVTAIDGGAAGARIAKQLVNKWAKARSTDAAPNPN